MATKPTVPELAKGDGIVQQSAAQMAGQGEFLLYQSEDARTRVQLRLDDGTVWMSQKQLADLYQVKVPTINAHLKNLFQDGELAADRTIRKFLIVAREGARNVERLVDHYNLDGDFCTLAIGCVHIGVRSSGAG